MLHAIITVDGEPLTTHEDDESILDVLQRNNIDVQAHCKNGYCGVCRTKCIKGDVDYIVDPLASIEENEILPCSCMPIGNIELSTQSAIN